MPAPNVKAPPGRWPDGAGIEGERAATQFDEHDCSLSDRYCKPLPLCLIADALLEKIERAFICREALHIDGFNLLELTEGFLPFWLSDAPSIVASDILVGRAIRAAFAAEGIRPPPIFVDASNG